MSNEPTTPDTREKLASQIPAVELLMKLGFRYLPPTEALQARGGRKSEVLLTPILREQLTKLNRVRWRGREQAFSPDAIEGAVAAMRDLPDEGLIQTSEKVYDLLSLGKSFPQTVEGDTRSFTLRYVDWDRWADNVFHVTEEYSVERTGLRETYRVDLVLFVNGIPFAVIECKPRGKKWLDQGISQHLRNQKNDGIPRLYWFAQLVIAVNGESARYATARTPAEFWSAWQEPISDGEVQTVLNKALPVDELVKLFWRREGPSELHERSVTAQDRAVFGLCRPERLIELTREDENLFVLVDEGHRTNFGSFHALMRKALPHACFIGFTGTPVVQDEKRNNLRVFGDFIHTYTLDHAVRDEAVVPLLYEGRHVEQDVDQAQLDLWFERMMRGKTEQQKADFKRKFATADHLNRADKRLLMIAYDLCEHFTSTFANTGAICIVVEDTARFITRKPKYPIRSYTDFPYSDKAACDKVLAWNQDLMVNNPTNVNYLLLNGIFYTRGRQDFERGTVRVYLFCFDGKRISVLNTTTRK